MKAKKATGGKKKVSKEQVPTSDSKVYSFRVKLDVAEKWDAKIAASGYNKSKFFSLAVEENQSTVAPYKALSPEDRRIRFTVCQLAQNVNQLAHRLNSDHKAGIVTPHLYEFILSELSTLAGTARLLILGGK